MKQNNHLGQSNEDTHQKSPQERYEICTGGMWLNRCPELNTQNGRCKLCSCFVSEKVKIQTESCPLKKW